MPDRVVHRGTHGAVASANVSCHLAAAFGDGRARAANWLWDDDGHANARCDDCDASLALHGCRRNDTTEAHGGIRPICKGRFDRLAETFPTKELT